MKSPCSVCTQQWPEKKDFVADLGQSKAYLHTDQFFPGWCVLVLKKHATELFHLSNEIRNEVMHEVSLLAQALQQAFQAVKINYSLLGNLEPHIHWHITPRLVNDPAPKEPAFAVKHEASYLNSAEHTARINLIRNHLDAVIFSENAHEENYSSLSA